MIIMQLYHSVKMGGVFFEIPALRIDPLRGGVGGGAASLGW